MSTIYSETTTETFTDKDGKTTSKTTEKTKNYQRNDEPDYIKLYTRMWCEFNQIPIVARDLFLEMAISMSYANQSSSLSQIVYVGKVFREVYCSKYNIQKAQFQKKLKMLVDCEAVKKIQNGVYQINPNYAGRGEWKYNPRLERGGIENLIATFNFKDKTVTTQIVEADSKSYDNENHVEDSVFDDLDNSSFDEIVKKESRVY